MKRILPALMCVFFALWLSYGSYAYVGKQTGKLCSAADTVLAEGNDIFGDAKRLCAQWEKVRISFGAFLKHSDVDELGKYFILIERYAASEQKEALLETVGNCRAALLIVLEGEKPDIANIL